jgi:dienelactone hydrolase
MPLTRQRLWEVLGWSEPAIELLTSTQFQHENHVQESLIFQIGSEQVRGVLTRPKDMSGPLPAILYAHSHGGKYHIGADELVQGREYLLDPPGPALARAGYLALCIDMPCFGERSNVSESSASKALLWYGKSLFGQMLCEEAAALSYLSSRTDVDPTRIGALGISMGSTLSYFHAALDERIAAVAHLCCFADQRTMIELGAHDRHGIYMMVPGLLNEADAGPIAALIAPRPQLVCIGTADDLTPPLAVDRAWTELAAAYKDTPAQLTLVSESNVGHQETARMRAAVLSFFADQL